MNDSDRAGNPIEFIQATAARSAAIPPRRRRPPPCGRRPATWVGLGASPSMADGIGEFGAVQGVEMKFRHAVLLKTMHLLDRDVRRNQAARVRIIVQAVEAPAEPFGMLAPQRSAKRRNWGNA